MRGGERQEGGIQTFSYNSTLKVNLKYYKVDRETHKSVHKTPTNGPNHTKTSTALPLLSSSPSSLLIRGKGGGREGRG